MVVLGLTGGIACGKSTVGRWMVSRGVPLVDADRVSREVTLPGSEGHGEVTAAFGHGVLGPDGAIDRKKLGAIVFNDPTARATLNRIVHPRIAAESARQLGAYGSAGHSFALYEAAVIIETGAHRGFEGVVVVTAQPEVQLARLLARDGAGESDARARIASQWPMAKKVAEARWVVDNSSSLSRLEARIRSLYATLVLTFGAPARPQGVDLQ